MLFSVRNNFGRVSHGKFIILKHKCFFFAEEAVGLRDSKNKFKWQPAPPTFYLFLSSAQKLWVHPNAKSLAIILSLDSFIHLNHTPEWNTDSLLQSIVERRRFTKCLKNSSCAHAYTWCQENIVLQLVLIFALWHRNRALREPPQKIPAEHLFL